MGYPQEQLTQYGTALKAAPAYSTFATNTYGTSYGNVLNINTGWPLVSPITIQSLNYPNVSLSATVSSDCGITQKGFERLLSFVKPGVFEYEIEAELIHEFIRNRSRGFAFDPIIASGSSACVLHYIDNNKPCKDGDLLLLDFGAEYGNYNGDLSRCIPVNGRFSARQKEVYNAVLFVQREAKKLLKPGVSLPVYHEEVCKIMSDQLIQLGLLTTADVKANPKAHLKYYMHGTSHHLGLDVHDVMHRWDKIGRAHV